MGKVIGFVIVWLTISLNVVSKSIEITCMIFSLSHDFWTIHIVLIVQEEFPFRPDSKLYIVWFLICGHMIKCTINHCYSPTINNLVLTNRQVGVWSCGYNTWDFRFQQFFCKDFTTRCAKLLGVANPSMSMCFNGLKWTNQLVAVCLCCQYVGHSFNIDVATTAAAAVGGRLNSSNTGPLA